ncbi:histone methyltransferase set2 [Rhizina undulata]
MKSSKSSHSPNSEQEGMGAAVKDLKLEDPVTDLVVREETKGDVVKKQGSRNVSKASSPKNESNASSPSNTVLQDGSGPISTKQSGDGEKPKLLRTSSKKALKQPPALFDHLPDSTADATSTFTVIESCIYSNKYIGDADQDGEVMSCDCKEEWDGNRNFACDENSDCINRLTSMECTQHDCGCGKECQNQRFQRREYADVSVIKTEKKGFGLRANVDLRANTFIYEYIGEVIDEGKFRRRVEKYDSRGIKHFYFMSLGKNEFIDATEKGCLARFCNHSCNPNCYVDKWVVGEKLRMGIFAKRSIKAGEELVFDYNVDRYGAEPQTCYCGEPNCLGYIGGKTQTDSAPKLSHHIIEALGLEDSEEWSTATAKKGRRPKKTGENDEEYVENISTKSLTVKDVTKVMSSLLHCKEKWIITKLLSRIQLTEDVEILARVVKMHGYQILGRILHDYKTDENVVLMVLEILMKFPRITKNKITSSKIEPTVQELANSEEERVRNASAALLKVWSYLETGFRIPRRVGAANEIENIYIGRDRSKSNSPTEVERPPTPTRPRNIQNKSFQGSSRGLRNERFQTSEKQNKTGLPWGWHKAYSEGHLYYYANDGRTRWEIPTESCLSNERQPKPPPAPLLPGQLPPDYQRNALQAIIDQISKKMTEEFKEEAEMKKLQEQQPADEESEQMAEASVKKAPHKPKYYDADKTRLILTKVLAGFVPNIVNKWEAELGDRAAVKKWSKEITDVLIAKEMKDGRLVPDPQNFLKNEKRRNKIKAFIKPYMEKVIIKKKEHAAAKKLQRKKNHGSSKYKGKETKREDDHSDAKVSVKDADDYVEMSPVVISPSPKESSSCNTPGKRRREEDDDSDSQRETVKKSPKRIRAATSRSPRSSSGPEMIGGTAAPNGVEVW